jgi:hypothetical protein
VTIDDDDTSVEALHAIVSKLNPRATIGASGSKKIREVIAELVEAAVAAGVIVHDEGTRRAIAVGRIPLPSNEPISSEWIAASHAWAEEYQLVEDLNYFLRDGRAQSVALRALGVPLVNATVTDQFTALTIESEVALVAHGWGLPPATLERIRPLLRQEFKRATGFPSHSVPPWAINLGNLLSLGMHLRYPDPQDGDNYRTKFILSTLASSDDQLPPKLKCPDQRAMARVERLLSTLRVNTLTAAAQAGQGKSMGPARTTWGAVVAFATCFAIRLPASERDARRRVRP